MNSKMTKQDLIDAVAQKMSTSKVEAGKFVNAVLDTVGEMVFNNQALQIVGFGTFKLRKTPARTGRNPRTGKEISIGERTTVTFSAGKQLKAKVSGVTEEAE